MYQNYILFLFKVSETNGFFFHKSNQNLPISATIWIFCPECTLKHWPQTDSSSRLKNCNNIFRIFFAFFSLLIDQKFRFRFRGNSSTVFLRKCSFGARNIERSRNSTRRPSGLAAVPTSSPGPVSHGAAVKAHCMPRDREVAGSNPAGWCFFHFSIPSVGHP